MLLDLYSSRANTEPYSGMTGSYLTFAASIRAPRLKSWQEKSRRRFNTCLPEMMSSAASVNWCRSTPKKIWDGSKYIFDIVKEVELLFSFA